MSVGDDVLKFYYDGTTPVSLTYKGGTYYYITNLQGDVVAIVNQTGRLLASYSYDAWDNPISINNTMFEGFAELNPLRYRGYVYDQETGLYYLQSRYYNAKIGRFINADAYISTGQGILGNNMFAYCLNNPINFSDPTGDTSIWGYLFQDFKFGLIHWLVEEHLLETHKHVGKLKREYTVPTGRADIVNVNTGDVWEIKHGRMGYVAERIEQAFKQVAKYLGYGEIKQPGPAGTFNGFFTINCVDVSYLVEYSTPSAGVILYTVTPQEKYETSPYRVYEPVHAPSSSQYVGIVPATIAGGYVAGGCDIPALNDKYFAFY